MTFMRLSLAAIGLAATLGLATSAAHAATQTGTASWYQMGTRTANGEAYDPDGMTAAHRNLPFGTIVKVENLVNGRSVRLRINDRGPFIGGRIIDVSRGGARHLGLVATGTAKVRVTVVGSGGSKAVTKAAGKNSAQRVRKVAGKRDAQGVKKVVGKSGAESGVKVASSGEGEWSAFGCLGRPC